MTLLQQRADTSTICPSDAAKVVGRDDWRPLMDEARAAANRLVDKDCVEITQKGEVVDGRSAKGPIRIRRKRA